MIKDLEIPVIRKRDGRKTVVYAEPYGEEQYRRIAEYLNVPIRALWKDLRVAAIGYCPGDGPRSGRKYRRKAYKNIAQNARSLAEALRDPVILCSKEPDGGLLGVTMGDLKFLKDIAARASKAEKAVPKSGAQPRYRRLEFIRELADIYEKATGEPPKRTYDAHNEKEAGKFLEFVRLCIELLADGPVEGLDTDVRKVCDERRSRASGKKSRTQPSIF